MPENFRLLVGGHDLNDTMNNEYFYIDQIFIVRDKLLDLVQTFVYNFIFLTVLKINCIIFCPRHWLLTDFNVIRNYRSIPKFVLSKPKYF